MIDRILQFFSTFRTSQQAASERATPISRERREAAVEFLTTRTRFDFSAELSINDLNLAYRRWAKARRVGEVSRADLGREVRVLHPAVLRFKPTIDGRRVPTYAGLRLISEE
jgi:hypothetical protein